MASWFGRGFDSRQLHKKSRMTFRHPGFFSFIKLLSLTFFTFSTFSTFSYLLLKLKKVDKACHLKHVTDIVVHIFDCDFASACFHFLQQAQE